MQTWFTALHACPAPALPIPTKNSRSVTDSAPMKLRVRIPLNTGSASSHSVVATTTNCASRSQGSMKPFTPET